MNSNNPAVIFDKSHAENREKKLEKLAPLTDALHLCMQFAMMNLPENAHILCVGAGTGAEMLALARAFPNWHFTAVEPSNPMLSICREKIAEAGFEKRCIFHEGYLDSLPETALFDAATSILVSQFVKGDEARTNFFKGISERLKENGLLISADIAVDTEDAHFTPLIKSWKEMYIYNDMPADTFENSQQIMDIQTPEKVASVIKAGGFQKPVLFKQTLLIHAWQTRKA